MSKGMMNSSLYMYFINRRRAIVHTVQCSYSIYKTKVFMVQYESESGKLTPSKETNHGSQKKHSFSPHRNSLKPSVRQTKGLSKYITTKKIEKISKMTTWR